MIISTDTYNWFNDELKYDVRDTMERFSAFIRSDYPKILDYYAGRTPSIDKTADKNLNNISSEIKSVLADMSALRDRISVSSDVWEIVDMMEDMNMTCDYILSLDRWSRGTSSSSSYKRIPLGQETTIERAIVDNGIQGDVWAEIAISNGIEEIDYNTDGGTILQVSEADDSEGIMIRDVVEDMSSPKSSRYGKDIKRKMSFLDNDIDCVSGIECRNQMIDIHSQMAVGSAPEDLSFGHEMLPSSKSSLPIEVIARQVKNTILHDDSIRSVNVEDIKYDKDSIKISLEITDKFGESERIIV